MLKCYETKEEILTRNCDMTGQWRPGAILETMQEAAGAHAQLLGCGRDVLLEQGLVWILSRSEVLMDRYPSVGETVTIQTFPTKARRMFMPRYYIFRDETGLEIGCAGTLWLLMDIHTRSMASPAPVIPCMPDNSDLPAPLGLPSTVALVPGDAQISRFTPVYTDLDVNQHVNNTRYMDWCCNALGINRLKTRCLRRFSLNYNAEILPGQEVQSELHVTDSAFSYSGFVGDRRCIDIGGELADR